MAWLGNWLNRWLTLMTVSLASLSERKGLTVVAGVGFAAVVTVFVAVFSIREGLDSALARSGSKSVVIVMARGAENEVESRVQPETADVVEAATGPRHEGGAVSVWPELIVTVGVKGGDGNGLSSLLLRGMVPESKVLHDQATIIRGRMMRPGAREVVVGVQAARRFSDVNVGSTLRIAEREWPIVGVFEASGGLHESEIWSTLGDVQQAFNAGRQISVVRAAVAGTAEMAELERRVENSQQISAKMVSEKDYYAEKMAPMRSLISGAGGFITFLMAFGAVFGAVNTMYTSVGQRTEEFAILKALGFGKTSILASVLVEGMFIGALGGLLGVVMSYAVFNGYVASTAAGGVLAQVSFEFEVSPALMMKGLAWGLIMGVLGGMLPAMRAAARPPAVALRDG